MKRALVIIAALVAGAAAADFSLTWLSASATTDTALITRLPDGGASYQACGHAVSNLGGEGLTACTSVIELSGANQTTALNTLNAGIPLYKTKVGL